MVIVSQTIKKHSRHINIRFVSVPISVVAAAEARNENLSGYLDRVVLVTSLIESIFDPVDDLVSDLKVSSADLLVLIDFFDQLLNVVQFFNLFLGIESELHL